MQKWFLQQFCYLPLQSTILKSLSSIFVDLDNGFSQPNIQKQYKIQ